jgi:invasion protein IalB
MRCTLFVLAAGLAVAAPASLAQEREGAMEARPPNSAWVKLCDTPTSASKDLFGKAQAVGAKTCLTHHERLDGASGTMMVAAAVRQAGGRQTLTVMVPNWVQLAPGMRIYIYPPNLWERMQRKERLQKEVADRLGMVSLKFAFCHADGCTAETDATSDLVADLKSNAGLMVFAFKDGRPIAYAIPLNGFREAYDGPPTDSARFHAARSALLRKIRDRQRGEQTGR